MMINFLENCITWLKFQLDFLRYPIVSQDTRRVYEPVIPGYCIELQANNKNNTVSIQNALNQCALQKQMVLLSPSVKQSHFYSGPITIPSEGGLIINSGAILSAIADPFLYDNGKDTCGTLDNSGKGCKPFITAINTNNSGIFGEGIIDGQGGEQMKGKSLTWWQLASEAKVQNLNQNVPRLIEVDNSTNFTVYKIKLKNSPNFHLVTNKVNGFTVWGITIKTPADARNTDGIDPGSSSNVTIAHNNISTGDDNIAIKAGNSGTSQYISILNNNFGKGHGMSIGSETNSGVNNVEVKNLTFNGTTSGLRIKSDRSRGGLVENINYTDICIKNVKYPIYLDTYYNKNASGDKIPEYKNIIFNNVKVLTTGTFIFNGFSDSKPIHATLNNVHIKSGSNWVTSHASINGNPIKDATGSTCPNYYIMGNPLHILIRSFKHAYYKFLNNLKKIYMDVCKFFS